METGNSSAGLEHITGRHADDFRNIDVSSDQIPDLVISALTRGEVVGYQGSGNGRTIYEVNYGGKPVRVAITVGSNGFIVGANPVSRE